MVQLSLVMQGFKKSFTIVFQILLCRECFENVQHVNVFTNIPHTAKFAISIVKLFLKQSVYSAKNVTLGDSTFPLDMTKEI
jgi:hypothetical protein